MNDGKVVAVWKSQGLTPLETVTLYKKRYPQHAGDTISYAGRLDPMAEGVLLLLVGGENKKKTIYQNLEKTYESEFVLGITTDSLDALGIITWCHPGRWDSKRIERVMGEFVGKQVQAYPVYSSRTVQGKPLHWWARSGRTGEISIPSKTVEISFLTLIRTERISSADLYDVAVRKIRGVNGDFRQDKIIMGWENFAATYPKAYFTKVTIRVSCSSGTYVRQLVSDIGSKLGSGGFALSIIRTSVGDYVGQRCIKL